MSDLATLHVRRWRFPRRTLVFKTTIVTAAVMLVFGVTHKKLTDWADEQFILVTNTNPIRDAREAVIHVLRNGENSQYGKLQIVHNMYEQLLLQNQIGYLLGRRGEVLDRAPQLKGLEVPEFTGAEIYRIVVGGEAIGIGSQAFHPIHDSGELLGFVASIDYMVSEDISGSQHSFRPVLEVAPGTELYTGSVFGEQFEKITGRQDRVRMAIAVAVAVGPAIILGAVVALFITRRLRSLSRQVESSGEQGLPGPFQVLGEDEVSVLANSLNVMRAKVLGLVEDLRRQDASRRNWIAQVSHDIRTPLTSLAICLNEAMGALNRSDVGAGIAAIKEAKHDADRVGSLSANLLDVARLEIAEELHLEPVPPQELIADACRSVRPQAAKANIHLEVVGGACADIWADGYRLLRACENLVSNAVHHARERVCIGVSVDREMATFFVLDDGPGFPGGRGPINLADVQKAGNQVDSNGLGLLVVRRVVSAHGGTVTAENGRDGWTRVGFCIPVTSQPTRS